MSGTKIQIIEQAIEDFYHEGVESLSFNKLSHKLNLTQPALYNYFKNKMDLLHQCQIYAADQGRIYIDQLYSEKDPADYRIRAYLRGHFSWKKNYQYQLRMVLSMYEFAKYYPEIQKSFELTTHKGLDRIEAMVLSGHREGCWKITHSRSHAGIIHSLLIGELTKACNNEVFQTQEDFVIEYIIAGLRVTPDNLRGVHHA